MPERALLTKEFLRGFVDEISIDPDTARGLDPAAGATQEYGRTARSAAVRGECG